MAKMLLALEGTGELAGAAAHDPLPAGRRLLAHHRRLQRTRADLGKVERLRALRTERKVDRKHLRDHVAGALHGDRIADADIDGLALIVDAQRLAVAAEAADVVLVVKRRVLHHDAADRDRLQPRDGGQRAGAPDLDVDGEELRRRLLGRELVGDRPARRAGAQAEARLQSERVRLIDDAVDVVVEAGALALDVAIDGKRRLDVVAELHQRIDLEAPVVEGLDHAHLRLRRHVAHLAPGIGEEAQRPRRGDLRVLLAQRAGRGVARIDVEGLSLLLLKRVELLEVGLAEIDFAAHFDH